MTDIKKADPKIGIKGKSDGNGVVVTNHPKFVKQWAKRCRELYNKQGKEVANSFFLTFFNKDQQALINEEIRRYDGRPPKTSA